MEAAVEQLLQWTSSQGVVLNGIHPRELPGRGIGIVATRRLEANETILTVPTSVLRTLGNTPKAIKTALAGASVHAILAASLCLESLSSSSSSSSFSSSSLAIWKAVFPSRADVTASLPICWPPKLRSLLPPGARVLLAAQQDKFNKDWAVVSSSAFSSSIPKDDFLYAWLLVNTRTFYYTPSSSSSSLSSSSSSSTRKKAASNNDSHMALQPVADLFNHSPHGFCTPSFDHRAFTFTTTRPHSPGDELFIRYGPHPNDTLLVEYGFTLPSSTNPWDETRLDPYLCPSFPPAPSSPRRDALLHAGFWARYTLDSRTACYRTHVALRVLCLPPSLWRDVLDGLRDEDEDRELVDAELRKVLARCEEDVRAALEELASMTVGEVEMRGRLTDRWLQIQELVTAAISRLDQQQQQQQQQQPS